MTYKRPPIYPMHTSPSYRILGSWQRMVLPKVGGAPEAIQDAGEGTCGSAHEHAIAVQDP
jgi:hypothetical protein